jgi:hypothetical protein
MKKTAKHQQPTSGLAKLGLKLLPEILLRPLTVGDSPNCVQLSPNFAKPPGRCTQAGESAADRKVQNETIE